MRWCRYLADGVVATGVVEDEVILEAEGDPFDGHHLTGASAKLDDVRLLPPVMPGTFFCVGLNYADHVRHAQRSGHAVAFPERPEVGYRANSALIGHGEAIVKPADCAGRFEAEGELVAVIGRTLRRCSRDEAQAGVWGWTIGNDVSAREWQHSDRTLWRAKNSDTFKPMGPWIDTDAEPLSATTTLSVNGESRASFPTGAMIFDPFDYIVEISRYITLRPGDVLWMGADGGVGMGPGDVVSVVISGLGTLSNPVAEERPSVATDKEQQK
jgi:2-keto-4-pentenoate hydratase/2-oxohepta-3-ene-1,7-dioic acid hydratase in catechol pathway